MDILKDLAYAARLLRKNPAFAVTAIVTIALGIGASTAIFSVVNAVLLRPLPYSEPDRLTLIWGDMRARNVLDFPFPPGDFYDLRQQADLFEGIAAVSTFKQSVRMALGATPRDILRLMVGHGMRLSVAGVGFGLVAAFGLTRAMGSMLVEVKATDPPTFAAIAVVFVLIAAVASWLPARRAAALDPTTALRDE